MAERRVAVALFLGFMLGAAQTASAEDVLSPLVATPIAAPNPVLGADNKTHLAYEIVLMNLGSSAVAIDKVDAVDAASDTVLGTIDGEALAKMIRLNGGAKGTELPAGGSGVLFMDVTLDKGAAIPKAL
jgi:hypothetical protein